jgi:hypothetical protein
VTPLKEVVIHITVLWLFSVQDKNVEEFCKGIGQGALNSTTKDFHNCGRVEEDMCILTENLKARDHL